MMNILIIGNGVRELAWAEWVEDQDDLALIAVYPGFGPGSGLDEIATSDLDEALSVTGLDAAIIGGPIEDRAEALRRAAAEGLAIICLHPPGIDSEAYYHVALSRSETGAVVVPDLPLRLHPGVEQLQEYLAGGDLGTLRAIRHTAPAEPGDDLARGSFARMIDVMRVLLGEIETVTASGDPVGTTPEHELIVQLRAEGGRRGEVRISSDPAEKARITVVGSLGSLALEYDPGFDQPARLVRRASARADEQITKLDHWDSHDAVFEVLWASREPSDGRRPTPSPSLLDGTRAMELSEAVVRSLRRGRTIDLHYERISEKTSFRAVMTSIGCLIFLGILIVLPLSLAGRALGIEGAIYLAYLIPPILIVFVVLQFLQFGIKPGPGEEGEHEPL